jgi:hypothetical protein
MNEPMLEFRATVTPQHAAWPAALVALVMLGLMLAYRLVAGS